MKSGRAISPGSKDVGANEETRKEDKEHLVEEQKEANIEEENVDYFEKVEKTPTISSKKRKENEPEKCQDKVLEANMECDTITRTLKVMRFK